MPHELRAVEWTGSGIALIDQTLLPHRTETRHVQDVDALVDAIRRLVVRGAPAIGAAGAYGVALAQLQGEREGWTDREIRAAVARVREARPTAVNLMVCVDRVADRLPEGLGAMLEEAAAVQREDVEANRAMGAHGADWLLERLGADRPLRILTHCNTGALATAGWGTALGVIRELHARGLLEVVYADETRPLLQGSRLTAWELVQEGIPHYVQADGAPPAPSCAARSTRRSSAPTASRPTVTRRTRSAPWASPWPARTPASRSWSRRPPPRSTWRPRRATTSTSNSATRPRCWSGRACAPLRPGPAATTRRSTSRRGGW